MSGDRYGIVRLGYLRDLTRRAELGEFGLGPMLMALVRTNATVARRVR